MTTPLHTRILSVPVTRQNDSPLFCVLPAEVRSHIFSYALTDYPDPSPSKRYETATCYTRPSYFAPRRTDTDLLQTCRAVYAESWFLPVLLREQVHYLAAADRTPPHYRSPLDSMRTARLAMQKPQTATQSGNDRVEIAGLRVFAQMWRLEQGDLARLLERPGLYPRTLTLTIRHADWWYWENDEPLRFEAQWIRGASKVIPSSVREMCIELESTVRRKGQVDSIARQMREKWFFKRADGVVLYADTTGASCEVSGWRGNSTWNGETWTRDETEPGVIDYYVISVPFRPEHVVERRGGTVGDEAKRAAETGIYNALSMRLDTREENNHGDSQSDGDSGSEWSSNSDSDS